MQLPVSEEIIAIKRKYSWPLDTLRYRQEIKERYLAIGKQLDHHEIITRIAESYRKISLAKSFLWLWKSLPWVDMVFITGSTASLNALPKDDIDFWVIVAPNRIWLTRFIEGVVLVFSGRRRMRNTVKVMDTFCINFYMTTKNLALHKQTAEFAMQFVDAIPLFIRDDSIYRSLLRANQWVKKYFPEWYIYQESELKKVNTPEKKRKNGVLAPILDLFDTICGVFQILVMNRKVPKNIKELLSANYFTTWKDSDTTR